MKKGIIKKSIVMLLLLTMVFCVNIGTAQAEAPKWDLTNYSYMPTPATEGDTATLKVELQNVGGQTISSLEISRKFDSFTASEAITEDYSSGVLTVIFYEVKHNGGDNSFKFRVNSDGNFQDVSVTISEVKEPETPKVEQWMITKYTVYQAKTDGTNGNVTGLNSVSKGSKVNVEVAMKYPGGLPSSSSIMFDRSVDSFNGGVIESGTHDLASGTYIITVRGLEYKGSGSSLAYTINTDGTYQKVSLNLVEMREYVEPTVTEPEKKPAEVVPMPYALFTRGQLTEEIKANDEFYLTINIKNKGKTTMISPIATIELSECLMNMTGQDSFEMSSITSGSTGSLTIRVKATSDITSQIQYATASLRFDYNDGTNVTAGNTSGKVSIPCKLTKEEEKTEDEKTDSPVPNMIVTKFNYGAESVAAGSDFNFGFTFKNTSKKLDVENIVVTVESAGFTPNGAANTFYFTKLEAGDTQSVSLPMKAGRTFAGLTEDITLNFSYEYVDKKVRHPMNSNLKVSVPVYQKDRFEITPPIVPAICYEGEEMSLTLDYVNKGKSAANNVEAVIEGDITSPNPTQVIGNIESGRNGQFAFAFTPLAAGECNFTITVTYEDANENIKERVFPVTMNVEAAMWDDPGEWEDPGMPDEPEQKSNLWKYILAALVIALIVLLVALRKKKKAKAIKQEANQWKAWEEEFAKEEAASDAAVTGETGEDNSIEQNEEKEENNTEDSGENNK